MVFIRVQWRDANGWSGDIYWHHIYQQGLVYDYTVEVDIGEASVNRKDGGGTRLVLLQR